MNRELIAARCEAGGLSIHAAAMKAWVDPVVLWEDPGSEADDRIPLGVLRRLCSILDVDLTELVESRDHGPEDEDGDVSADDVRVEAALAEFEEVGATPDPGRSGRALPIVEGFGSTSFFKEEPGPGAVKSLLRQGLIERKRGQYFVSADVAFSLAFDD